MSEIKRCPSCRRSKSKAIREQVAKKEPCGFQKDDCFFFNEIKDALEKKNNIKVVKKEKRKTNVKIEKKEKKKINIVKK
jgi:hypothetical protein